MNLAIAVEHYKHPAKKADYKVWYLELNSSGDVTGIGVKSREELLKDLFANYQKTGSTNWKAFKKGSATSTPIEIYDFIAQNMNENTHFGNLPTLGEFQEVLGALQCNMEIRSIA